MLFNAPPNATIDLEVAPPRPPVKLSEYEKLLTNLSPILEGVQPADLTEDDIAFIVGDTGIDRERILILRKSAQILGKVKVPSEAFYGLFRKGLPQELEELLALKRSSIMVSLKGIRSDAGCWERMINRYQISLFMPSI